MPKLRKHAATGGAVGIALTALGNYFQQQKRKQADPTYQFDWSEMLGKSLLGGAIGSFCGVLPDLLEPATSPRHRKFFHSLTAASAIGYGMYKANKSDLDDSDKELINLAGSCYLSHLVLDSNTPFSLPLVA
jgi:membrane-bound metal-dependent hydrolase YbcI (DUF457 family)